MKPGDILCGCAWQITLFNISGFMTYFKYIQNHENYAYMEGYIQHFYEISRNILSTGEGHFCTATVRDLLDQELGIEHLLVILRSWPLTG